MEKSETYQLFHKRLKQKVELMWHGRNGVLAQEVGISPGYMTDILKGRKEPTVKVQEKLASACGGTYLSFITPEPTLTPEPETAPAMEKILSQILKEIGKLELKMDTCENKIKALHDVCDELKNIERASANR